MKSISPHKHPKQNISIDSKCKVRQYFFQHLHHQFQSMSNQPHLSSNLPVHLAVSDQVIEDHNCNQLHLLLQVYDKVQEGIQLQLGHQI